MPDVFRSNEKENSDGAKHDSESVGTPLTKKHRKLLNKEKQSHLVNIEPTTDIHKLPGHSHNPLSAFCFYPDNIKFLNADRNEKIVLLLRQHPISNLSWMFISFFMVIMPAFATVITFFETLPLSLVLVMLITWYLITTAFILEQFLEWYFNVNIVTDERIFDVDFINLMYREITEADLDQIQDVTVEVGGAVRTFFNFGNVLIQTASQVPRIEFHAVPYPDKVAKVLRELGLQEEIEKIEGRIR